jgi:hypothetical protein
MSYLDEQLQLIYIQENLKSFNYNKIKNLLKTIKDPKDEELKKLSKMLPKTEMHNIQSMASKSPDVKKYYEEEMKKTTNLPPDVAKLQAYIASCFNVLKSHTDKKSDSFVDKAILTLYNICKKYGTYGLTAGLAIKLIAFLGKYLWEFHIQFPELRDIFNLSSELSPVATKLIIISIFILIIAFLLKVWLESRRSKGDYRTGKSKSPYEES